MHVLLDPVRDRRRVFETVRVMGNAFLMITVMEPPNW